MGIKGAGPIMQNPTPLKTAPMMTITADEIILSHILPMKTLVQVDTTFGMTNTNPNLKGVKENCSMYGAKVVWKNPIDKVVVTVESTAIAILGILRAFISIESVV